jgi:hypothetical protein
MIAGALAVSTAIATERENTSTNEALLRECCRYHLDYDRVKQSYEGLEPETDPDKAKKGRGWWDYAIIAAAVGVFVFLGVHARPPALSMNMGWVWALAVVLAATASACGWALWKSTRFA